jgi:hypothetical protein
MFGWWENMGGSAGIVPDNSAINVLGAAFLRCQDASPRLQLALEITESDAPCEDQGQHRDGGDSNPTMLKAREKTRHYRKKQQRDANQRRVDEQSENRSGDRAPKNDRRSHVKV